MTGSTSRGSGTGMAEAVPSRPVARRPSPAGPGQGEALAVWAGWALLAVAVLVTYSHVDPADTYAVSRDGVAGGLSRTLTLLNFPIALGAIALVLLAVPALPSRAWWLAGPAIAMCAVTAWPGVVDPGDLDARLVNAVPALGVVAALGLTAAASRRAGAGFAPWGRGDVARVVVGAAALVIALPWIVADLGTTLPGDLFMGEERAAEGERLIAAVHVGHHHGLDGALIFVMALVLSRRRPGGRAGVAYAAYLSLALAYGLANMLEDSWHEQLVKREWLDWRIPSAKVPELHWIWLVILAGTVAAFALGFAGGATSRRSRALP